jgi:hypothetical protein
MPDEDLNIVETLSDLLQPRYTLVNDCFIRDFYTVQVPAVRYLEKLVLSQIDKMMKELSDSLTLHLGEDVEGWRDFCVFETIEKITSQVGNYFIVGKPLCKAPVDFSLI